ncbi:Rv3235 family protein [Cellulomonas endophytica]|uniref:Rv3235 family protein n=1 Tax=Cellulomonas endophytica TaxID=2494735 RepID=UPI001011B02A|nr:Rv3235 family protein [Cellulomonas endophytica]
MSAATLPRPVAPAAPPAQDGRPAPVAVAPAAAGPATVTPAAVTPAAVTPAAVSPARVRLVRPAYRGGTADAGPLGRPAPPALPDRVRALRTRDASFEAEVLDADDVPVPEADPARTAGTLARAVVEVLAGTRPVAQLARWLAPGVYEELRVRTGLTLGVAGRGPVTSAGTRPAVRRVRVVPVDERSVEATVVVDQGTRVRAAALRLDAHRGQWRVTALELG